VLALEVMEDARDDADVFREVTREKVERVVTDVALLLSSVSCASDFFEDGDLKNLAWGLLTVLERSEFKGAFLRMDLAGMAE
jgi:hypothetical protein